MANGSSFPLIYFIFDPIDDFKRCSVDDQVPGAFENKTSIETGRNQQINKMTLLRKLCQKCFQKDPFCIVD
jgi:hypothetical protein